MGVETEHLYDQDRAAEFYEDRYQTGYMDEWPVERKRKLVSLLRGLPLPAHGDALDFGCGNGVLTEVLRQALPGWKISGTDISATAIRNASERYPDCRFFEAGNADRKFDLVFTHHVLEHVFDMDNVLGDIDGCLKPECFMLHILPCGNEGSYEHRVCLLRRDGIDQKLEGRFFFEDVGHVRRLTTDRLGELCEKHGFALSREFYANQRDGAIEWLTNEHPRYIRGFADPEQAVDAGARKELKRLRRKLTRIALARLPARLAREVIGQHRRGPAQVAAFILSLPLLPLSFWIDRLWKRRAATEWANRCDERAGSEMTLFFSRG